MPVTQRKRAFQLFRKLKFCSSTTDDDQYLEYDKMMLHTLDCLGALSTVLERYDNARVRMFWHAVSTIAELGNDSLTGHIDRRHPGASQLIRAFPNDVKATDGRGWLPLHWAAVCDDVTVEEIKSIAKADPLAAVKGFNQPISANPGHLIAASRHPDMRVVKCLYDFYPRMAHTRDNEGDLPLHYAARYTQSSEMIKYLLQANPIATKVKGSGNMIPLHCAIYNEDPVSRFNVIKCLIEVDKSSVIATNSDGDSVLHLAIHHDIDVNLAKFIISSNRDVAMIRNSTGELPLHKACHVTATPNMAQPLKVMIDLLLDIYPESTQECTQSGLYAAHVAAEYSSLEIFDRLVKTNPSVMNMLSDGTGTPLHHAVSGNNLPIVSYILKNYSSVVSVPNKNGFLPIHVASGRDNLEILKLVYNAYPQGIKEFSFDGKLPLHVFAVEEFEDEYHATDKEASILRFLLKADPDAVAVADSHGNIPYIMCPRDNLYFRRLLLRAKPELNRNELIELNYAPRRMALFLSFSAINANGIPSIWVRLRAVDNRLLQLAVSFL